MLNEVGHHLVHRAITGGFGDINYTLPFWAWPLALADFFLFFIPLLIYTGYTLQQLYPIFTIIEDENPPAYEPLSLDDTALDDTALDDTALNNTALNNTALNNTALNDPDSNQISRNKKPAYGRQVIMTSSLRSINRLLRTNGGFMANFRGSSIFFAQAIITYALKVIFGSSLGSVFQPLATLLASLSLIQFSAAWVHIVITPGSRLHFWKRLPAFKRTFDATWKPVVIYWFATELALSMPILSFWVCDLHIPTFGDADKDSTVPESKSLGKIFLQAIIVLLPVVLSWLFIVIPAKVILVRVQASLIPVEEDTIIPFDRTFDGKVEPQVVGGRGYATISDVWSTYSKAGWRRLVILYVKATLAVMALHMIHAFAVTLPIIILAIKHSTKDAPRV